MASYQDLFDAIARVRTATGNPDSWRDGLSGEDVAVICNPLSPPGALGAVLAKITAAHPDAFRSAAGTAPPPGTNEGVAADAVRGAQSALAQQHSAAAQLDLRVVTAVLNAHAAHGDGLAELDRLQAEIEEAVLSRSDLGTAAGAREFQRFLTGKLRDIRAVVDNADLDAASRAALAAALASLYAAATPESAAPPPARPGPSGETGNGADKPSQPGAWWRPPAGECPAPAGEAAVSPTVLPVDVAESDLPGDLPAYGFPGLPPEGMPAPIPIPPAPQAVPPMATPAPLPQVWGGGVPAGIGGAPAPPLPLPPLSSPAPPDLASEARRWAHESPVETRRQDSRPETPDREPAVAETDSPPADAADPDTTVALPDGQTVTAPTPELAAVVTAAVAGTPVDEAFRRQGITLPPPGTPVISPLSAADLVAGDIGVLADRYALALGNGTALLDNRIQPIASVTGPGFLGWSHPPGPDPVDSPPPEAPAPDRPAQTAPS